MSEYAADSGNNEKRTSKEHGGRGKFVEGIRCKSQSSKGWVVINDVKNKAMCAAIDLT